MYPLLISTFRNFYDNDFLSSHPEIHKRIVTVNTKAFNWMDFWMSDKDKMGLFREGAKAAVKQLKQFDWTEYKMHHRNSK